MYSVKLHLFTLQNLRFTQLHHRLVIERTCGGSLATLKPRHTSGLEDKHFLSSSSCSSVMIRQIQTAPNFPSSPTPKLQVFLELLKTLNGEDQTELL